ncbi:MAG TPA: ThuA domain-containing protein [Verrucomicrobiae bacterium]
MKSLLRALGALVALACVSFSSLALAADVDPFDQSKVPLEVDTTDTKLTKIVLLAGTPSNKSGQHEYFAGCALMMDLLKQTKGVHVVMARDGWPKNEAIFKNAKAVVYFGDGGGKQPFLEPAKWKIIEDLMKEKAGLVLMHQGVDFPMGPEKNIMGWLGGIFLKDIGCRGHWDMDFPEIGKHAVLGGVKPFKLAGDGWLYNMHFADKGVTPLLSGAVPDKSRSSADAKKYNGRAEVMAWAYERPEGGRGFAFTGADLHKNWAEESQRKLVVNGILWSAGLKIPQEGAPVAFDSANLQRNLDKKDAPAPAAKKAAEKK